MKNKIAILFILMCFTFSKAQDKKIQEKLYDDIIMISEDVFQKRSDSKKHKNRSGMYVTIYNNKGIYDYIISVIDKGDLRGQFKRNPSLFDKLFNPKELKYYKEQAQEGEFKFSHCDIETDSIFVFNKNRDISIIIDGRLRVMNKNKIYLFLYLLEIINMLLL